MKKLILVLTLILALCLTFVGCAEKEAFDTKGCVEDVKALGLVVKESSTEGDALALANTRLNVEINMLQGNFNVELTSFTHLTKESDDTFACKIYEFATEEQANMYGGFFMNRRGANEGWKVAIADKTVIVTNLTDVQNAIDVIFK